MSCSKHWARVSSLAALCLIVAGCGNSGTETADSSTNDTSYEGSARPSYSWWWWSRNNPPIADVTGADSYLSGETVTLDGSGSYDPDDDNLYYYWRQVQGPRVNHDGGRSDSLTFIAPEVSETTQLAFQLIVSDGRYSNSASISLQVTPIADTTAPSVTSRSPAANQTEVGADIQVSVSFNEALLAQSVSDSSLTLHANGSKVDGSVYYDSTTNSIIFNPSAPLAGNVQYLVSLGDGVQDLSGNSVSSESWSFTTAASDDTGGGDTGGGDTGGGDTGGGDTGGGDTGGGDTGGGDTGGGDTGGGDTGGGDTGGGDTGGGDTGGGDTGGGDTGNGGDTSGYNLGSTSQETIDACMDTADMEMLTLINNTRAQARNCGTTGYQAVGAVSWNCLLEVASERHSVSMQSNNYFSHTGIDGSSPGDRITAAGYRWRTYGENIAAGYSDAKSVMDGWISSPGHCANLMNSGFTEVGVGTATGGGYYGIYWTQDFAAPY